MSYCNMTLTMCDDWNRTRRLFLEDKEREKIEDALLLHGPSKTKKEKACRFVHVTSSSGFYEQMEDENENKLESACKK